MSGSNWNLGSSQAETRLKNDPVIKDLQDTLASSFHQTLPDEGGYAILDFPNYSNIGDSAIFVGAAILCRNHFGRGPEFVCEADLRQLDRIAKLDPSLPLLLSGGGNFGDLYPRHQQFREAVLSRFPDRKIVQLPQSIHYENAANIQSSAAVINAHAGFTLMVRDHASRDFAREHFSCETLLVPDMAFMIGAVAPTAEPPLAILGLIRRDKESVLSGVDDLEGLPKPFEIVDWPAEQNYPSLIERLPRSIRAMLPPRLQDRKPETPTAYEFLARKRLETGFAILSRGEMVLTDRLHAHILSILLGKPHVVLDNSYRKIGNFADAWTDQAGFVRADSTADAIELIKGAAPSE
ncbi:polysaccharide pyruvyl transferase family protein [Aurantiacibacter flavus]|uniref:Polysaccharide pyruvyl transferase family protein n=1 Tax=Aurantiacibacter flavus TaxID=3145232 RepID=A0ABV0CVY8_9SPHN